MLQDAHRAPNAEPGDGLHDTRAQMQIFEFQGGRVVEIATLPAALPPAGFLWIAAERAEFEAGLAPLQADLARLAGTQLVELHVQDLLSRQLPSQYDYTSQYDLLVFRRLAAQGGQPALRQDALSAAQPHRARCCRASTPPRSASPCSTACCCRCIRPIARYATRSSHGCLPPPPRPLAGRPRRPHRGLPPRASRRARPI